VATANVIKEVAAEEYGLVITDDQIEISFAERDFTEDEFRQVDSLREQFGYDSVDQMVQFFDDSEMRQTLPPSVNGVLTELIANNRRAMFSFIRELPVKVPPKDSPTACDPVIDNYCDANPEQYPPQVPPPTEMATTTIPNTLPQTPVTTMQPKNEQNDSAYCDPVIDNDCDPYSPDTLPEKGPSTTLPPKGGK
jgi:hypothetical protein